MNPFADTVCRDTFNARLLGQNMTTYFTDAPNPHLPVRPDWLLTTHEEALKPEIPIVDAHHHLWTRPNNNYFLPDFLRDIDTGHQVVASVFVECNTAYRATGPDDLKVIGETEFAANAAKTAASLDSRNPRVAAAIVGCVDLRRGSRVPLILDAQMEAGAGHFKGVRMTSAWHPHNDVRATTSDVPDGMLLQSDFRDGFAHLSQHGLSFDGWLYHTQLDDFIDLARSFPDTTLILNHVGAPVGVGPFAGKRDEVFKRWSERINELARCDNVLVKLSGLGLRIAGFSFHEQPKAPTSSMLADAWRPYIETCIEAFGPDRCMFASNFPVDKGTCSYAVLWNAFKRITSGCSNEEISVLFAGTAKHAYRLD